MWNLFKRKETKSEESKHSIVEKITGPRIIRVTDPHDLKRANGGFAFWNSEYVADPKIIEKIYNHLKTSSVIRLYVTRYYISYVAETKTKGQVSGSCHRGIDYGFFEFGLINSGHRFDIYGEDRKDPIIKEFYDWWESIVKPFEKEFDNDYNL